MQNGNLITGRQAGFTGFLVNEKFFWNGLQDNYNREAKLLRQTSCFFLSIEKHFFLLFTISQIDKCYIVKWSFNVYGVQEFIFATNKVEFLN